MTNHPNLLLLHGGPGMTDDMDDLHRETGGWRTIRYQQRGLAPSTLKRPYTVAQHVSDAVAVLKGLNVDKAVVLGNSWGGHLALQVALQAPDLVSAVIIVDGPGPDGDGGTTRMGEAQTTRLTKQAQLQLAKVQRRLMDPDAGDADYLEMFSLLWPGYFANAQQAPLMPTTMRVSGSVLRETGASMQEALASGAFLTRLSGLRVRTIVMVGSASPMPVDEGEKLVNAVPEAKLVIVNGGGHMPWVEQPGCVAQALATLRS
jgi:proline iminopeptidase